MSNRVPVLPRNRRPFEVAVEELQQRHRMSRGAGSRGSDSSRRGDADDRVSLDSRHAGDPVEGPASLGCAGSVGRLGPSAELDPLLCASRLADEGWDFVGEAPPETFYGPFARSKRGWRGTARARREYERRTAVLVCNDGRIYERTFELERADGEDLPGWAGIEPGFQQLANPDPREHCPSTTDRLANILQKLGAREFTGSQSPAASTWQGEQVTNMNWLRSYPGRCIGWIKNTKQATGVYTKGTGAVARAQEVLLDASYAAAHSCEPNANGWCQTDAAADAARARASTYAVFDYPADEVRLVFE